MRDYSNMPRLNWGEQRCVSKAKSQVRHQEPLVLNMPMNFVMDVDAGQHRCKYDERSGVLYDCFPDELMNQLADINRAPELKEIGDICIDTSSRVDLDQEKKRIIIHD